MLISSRGTVRHEKFSAELEKLVRKFPEVRQVIDGAIWEIERDPRGLGILVPELDVWQARLTDPPILLFYCFNRRFVTMLTLISTD